MGLNLVKYYKLHDEVKDPLQGTAGSACFDLCADLSENGRELVSYENPKSVIVDNSFMVSPNGRVLIPTGLVFDIRKGYSIRLHPRSGLSIKNGLALANAEGVIDSDYVEEVFVAIHNISSSTQFISNGTRICQGELVKNEPFQLRAIEKRPGPKTSRRGGFGSTGV
jgi:dUTP pyrophosphatase